MKRNAPGENAQNYDKILGHKILTREEEIALIARLDQAWPDRHTDDNWRTPPAEAAAVICEIVGYNYRLLTKMVGKFTGRELSFDDLFQEGFLGMVRGIIKFETARGVRLSTYITWWINQSLDRALKTHRANIRVAIHVQYTYNRIKRYMEDGLDYQVVTKEIGLDPSQIADILMTVRRSNTVSLDEPQYFEDGDQSSLRETIGDESSLSPIDEVIRGEMARRITDVLETLNPREAKILTLRYGLDDGCPRTLEECGQMFGLTRERIRQIEGEALRKLRHPKRSRMLREFAND